MIEKMGYNTPTVEPAEYPQTVTTARPAAPAQTAAPADAAASNGASTSGPARRRLSPHEAGWAQAAMAICGVRQLDDPVTLVLRIEGTGTVTINAQTHSYSGDISPHSFPTEPAAVFVETRTPSPSTDSSPEERHDLDGLLWRIGYHSYDGVPASWLGPGRQYRLSRWPNIGSLDIDGDELRLIALLAHGFFTPEALATQLDGELSTAHRVINALSLIGLLSSIELEASPAPSGPSTTTAHPPGLFGRLRKRLGF